MASIQRILTWTGLICNCYCSLPAFVPFWLPHIGNSSTFTGRSAWPIFTGWRQPSFLVEHVFELSVHNCSRWSFSIHWQCHYRSLGAVGIADTSIFQLVLSTNFQRQHGKVKLHKMPRPDWKEALMHSNSFEAWWCAASNPSKRAASNLCWLFFIVLTTNQGMPRNTDPVVHHAVRAASNTRQSKALCFSLLPKKTEFWRLNFGMANLASTTWKEAMMRTKSFKTWCAA